MNFAENDGEFIRSDQVNERIERLPIKRKQRAAIKLPESDLENILENSNKVNLNNSTKDQHPAIVSDPSRFTLSDLPEGSKPITNNDVALSNNLGETVGLSGDATPQNKWVIFDADQNKTAINFRENSADNSLNDNSPNSQLGLVINEPKENTNYEKQRSGDYNKSNSLLSPDSTSTNPLSDAVEPNLCSNEDTTDGANLRGLPDGALTENNQISESDVSNSQQQKYAAKHPIYPESKSSVQKNKSISTGTGAPIGDEIVVLQPRSPPSSGDVQAGYQAHGGLRDPNDLDSSRISASSMTLSGDMTALLPKHGHWSTGLCQCPGQCCHGNT